MERSSCLFFKTSQYFITKQSIDLAKVAYAGGCALHSINEQFIETTYQDILNALGTSEIQFKDRSKLIIKSIGTVPCGESDTISKYYFEGNRRFKKDDFQRALINYIYAIEASMTADLLNMTGMTLLRMNQDRLAIPFFRQSAWLNPSHRYAVVNLSEALFSSGYLNLGSIYYVKGLENASLDAWGKARLKAIKKTYIN